MVEIYDISNKQLRLSFNYQWFARQMKSTEIFLQGSRLSPSQHLSFQSVMKMAFSQTIFLSSAIRFCDIILKVNQYKNTLLLLFTCTETWALRIHLHLETLITDFPQQPGWHFLFETRHKTKGDWEMVCHQGLWLEELLRPQYYPNTRELYGECRVETHTHSTQSAKAEPCAWRHLHSHWALTPMWHVIMQN